MIKRSLATLCLTLWLGTVLVQASGCALIGEPERFERSLPHALALDAATLDELVGTLGPPFAVNVSAFVVEHFVCAPDHACFVENGFTAADAPAIDYASSVWIRVPLAEPRQLDKGRRYTLSLEVTADSLPNGNSVRRFRLLGYDPE